MELISVLMPTYNVRAYIMEAVDSILNQTYQNIELIIVDDASTDGTYEYLKQIKGKDKRIYLYRNENNCKICKTLNKALSHAKGEFIARMDGDDISTPDRLEVLKKYLDEHSEISLVGSQVITLNENGETISLKRYPYGDITIRYANRFISSVSHYWLARREMYENLHGYRDIPYAEDYDFLLRGERKGYHYANVPEYLYKCRLRQGNTASENGLLQRKTFYYVRKLHKKETHYNKNLFMKSDLEKNICCSEKQKKKYSKAAGYLNSAVTNKKNKLIMIVNVFIALSKSRYIFLYLVSAIKFRILIAIEDKIRTVK